MQTFYQYITGIVLLSVAVSLSIYHDTYYIAICIVLDDSRIVPALVVGTGKNRLNETFFLSTQNLC